MSANFPIDPTVGTPYYFNGIVWEYNGKAWEIVGSQVDIFGATGVDALFFPDNINTNFTNVKSWGKYSGGDRVPSKGKTAVTVIEEALIESLLPSVFLSSGSTVGFNQTSIFNIINFSHTIPDLSETIGGATLEFKKSTGTTWLFLTGSTLSGSTYGHSFTDSNFNTAGYQYRRTIIDTKNRSAQTTLTINPSAYSQPSVLITQTAPNLSFSETTIRRESGNVLTNISAGITRNSPNVQLTGWEFLYSVNGNGYQTTGFTAPVSGVGGFTSTGITQHSAGITANSIVYRLRVRDEYQDFLGSFVDSTPAASISFLPYIFYGPTGTSPSTSNEIRQLSSRVFSDTSIFNLLTGTAFTKFVVAMPNNYTISSVFDETANFFITSAYTDGLQAGLTGVPNYAGLTLGYNVYIGSVAIPYSPNSHTHRITRA